MEALRYNCGLSAVTIVGRDWPPQIQSFGLRLWVVTGLHQFQSFGLRALCVCVSRLSWSWLGGMGWGFCNDDESTQTSTETNPDTKGATRQGTGGLGKQTHVGANCGLATGRRLLEHRDYGSKWANANLPLHGTRSACRRVLRLSQNLHWEHRTQPGNVVVVRE